MDSSIETISRFGFELTVEGRGAVVIVASMQPAEGGEEDLDQWYKQEHMKQVSDQPGWVRSSRYELVAQNPDKGAPKFLALHEFEEGTLPGGTQVVAFEPVSDWTKKCMGSAKEIDAGKYKLIGSFGDQSAPM